MAREHTDMGNTAFPRTRKDDNAVGLANPGSEVRSKRASSGRTPTSIQNSGANRFGTLASGNSGNINTGALDSGDGTGCGGSKGR